MSRNILDSYQSLCKLILDEVSCGNLMHGDPVPERNLRFDFLYQHLQQLQKKPELNPGDTFINMKSHILEYLSRLAGDIATSLDSDDSRSNFISARQERGFRNKFFLVPLDFVTDEEKFDLFKSMVAREIQALYATAKYTPANHIQTPRFFVTKPKPRDPNDDFVKAYNVLRTMR